MGYGKNLPWSRPFKILIVVAALGTAPMGMTPFDSVPEMYGGGVIERPY